ATATDHGRATFNAGGGLRRYVRGQDRVYTVAGYFDWDDGNEREYRQGSVHLGTAGRWFDFNANAYFRESENTHVLAQQVSRTPRFVDSRIMLGQTTRFEQSMSAVDAEFGVPIPGLARYGLSIYLGGYYLKGDREQDTGGFQGRIEGNVNEDWKMSVSYSDDKLFGPNAWMNVILTLPDGIPHRWMRPQHGRAKMFNHVQRQNRIRVQQFEEIAQNPAINPIDGIAYRVLHLNPNAATDGYGTIESPFNNANSLMAANTAATDIIRIVPRSDDTGTNLSFNGGLSLFNNQRLLGSSTAHTFNELTWGTLPLPSQTPGGSLPWLSNSSATPGSVVVFANNNEASGFIIDGNYDPGAGDVATHYGISNGAASVGFNINRNEIRNAPTGIVLTNATGTGLLVANQIHDNTDDGFFLTNSSGALTMTIGGPAAADGNIIYNNGDAGVDFNLTGTATADVSAQNNFNISTVPGIGPGIGTNFVGSTIADSGFIPPDTMGGVGPDHIVEMINGVYAIYDKTTGAQISTSSLDAFWTTAMGAATAGTFDPRIVFDAATGRWFAASIDGGAGNTVFIAVSATNDPTGAWSGVSFVGDTVNGTRFNDFDTLAVTGDAIVIGSNNFLGGAFDTVSVYNIPKADLLGGVPSVANMTRFENLNAGTVGFTLQGAVDFAAATGDVSVLSISGTQLLQTTINAANTATATLSVTTPIAGTSFTPAPNAQQPGGAADLESDTPGISSNVVKVGGSLWTVHTVADPGTGRSALAWYEIDDATGTLLQSGLISDPTLDFLDGSVAVNGTGDVVIGFSGSGAGQFASSMAAVGTTAGGTTTFGTPMILQAGVDTYEVLAGGRNPWGDYSATVVDPSDPNSFWTFQEFVDATDSWAIGITQITMGGGTTVGGGNASDYFRFTADGTSNFTSLLVDSNNLEQNGGAAVSLISTGGTFTGPVISNNTFTNNLNGVSLLASAGGIGTVISPATVTRNTFTGHSGPGLSAIVEGPLAGAGSLNLIVGGRPGSSGNVFDGNTDAGILVRSRGYGVLETLQVSGNTIINTTDDAATIGAENPAGDGIFLAREDNSAFGIVGGTGIFGGLGDIAIGNNTVSGANSRGNTIMGNERDGIRLFGLGASTPGVNTLLFDGNTLSGNGGSGFVADLYADVQFLIANQGNNFEDNQAYGVRLVTNQNSAIGDPTAGTASTFLADTYTNNFLGHFSAVANDSSFQHITIGSTPGVRTTMTGGNNDAINITNNSSFSGGTSARNTYNIYGIDIDLLDSGTDGIEINADGTGNTSVQVGGTALNRDVTITGVTESGIEYSNTAGASNQFFVDSTTITDAGEDGISIRQTSGSMLADIKRSIVTGSTQRGLDISVESGTSSRYTIGGSIAGEGNVFNSNTQQGFAFRTIGGTYTRTTLVLDPAFVGNVYQDLATNGVTTHVRADLSLIGNEIRFNGTAANTADGAIIEVGTNSTIDAIVNSNVFGGNLGADLNAVVVVSANPAGTSVNNAVAGPPILDRVALDPIAYLNLALGVNAVHSGGLAPVASLGNTGEEFLFSASGSATSLTGSTLAGQFTNADLFKPTTRTAFGLFNFYTQGLITDPGAPDAAPFNVFHLNNIDQNIEAQVAGGGFWVNLMAPAAVFP
ncbi:MAG: hypothetical protein CMJ48_03985, partial [Planctomycetaceae bacterium]|nr:hypothetical protein [Planctomycetaceae bacterium]